MLDTSFPEAEDSDPRPGFAVGAPSLIDVLIPDDVVVADIDGYQAATARVFREYLSSPAAFDPLPTPITLHRRTYRDRQSGERLSTRSAPKPSSPGSVRSSVRPPDQQGAER